MTTTLSTEFKRLNYCTLPTIDVEVLTEQPNHCGTCGGEAVNLNAGQGYGLPNWVHTDPEAEQHYISPRPTCTYCGSDEGTTYRQHSWYDAIECTRCGGENGWPIGD